MKNTWIFFALVPLFSYAAIQEEWLLESYTPLELQQEKPLEKRNNALSESQTKEYRSQKTRRYRKSDAALQDKNRRLASRRAQKQHPVNERSQEIALSSHLEPLPASKEQPKKPLSGFHIETNRKPEKHAYLTQESKHAEDLVEEDEQEQSLSPENSVQKNVPSVKEKDHSKQYRYKARERISAETQKRDEEMASKRKNESAVKNNRRIQKDVQ